MGEIPTLIRSRVVDAVGSIQLAIDRSWPRENSNIWELATTAGRRFFLKRHPTPRFHEREVTAYRRWTTHLGYQCAPELVAADADLQCIITTALPGQLASERQTSTVIATRIYQQIGTLLRRLHDAAPPSSDTTSVQRVADRAEEHIWRAADHLQPHHEHLIRTRVARLLEIAPQLPAVPTHGDAQLKNFLWDPVAERLALIDFERAERAPAVRDFVRLESGPWIARPELRAAFFCGYVRQLHDVEKEALEAYIALDAVSGIQWGAAKGHTKLVVRSVQVLNFLSRRT